MITEDYVSFETAKLLKEKGFNPLECGMYYSIITGKRTTEQLTSLIACPTHQMAIKWLRKIYHWHIFVVPRWKDDEYILEEQEERIIGYQYVIVPVGKVNRKNEQPIITVPTPESAYEEAIKYCLENLI